MVAAQQPGTKVGGGRAVMTTTGWTVVNPAVRVAANTIKINNTNDDDDDTATTGRRIIVVVVIYNMYIR